MLQHIAFRHELQNIAFRQNTAFRHEFQALPTKNPSI